MIKCSLCGKFMSYSEYGRGVKIIPFGDHCDITPPNAHVYHRQCWLSLSNKLQDRKIDKSYKVQIPAELL